MKTSTHYGLNLVEGTDLVNPLIQDVPNYEAIDQQMYENSIAGIGTAVELLSGTVHALTRVDENCPAFRFTATADFTAGETFVVDGAQVTALLPSGEALGTGAYVIGSEVFCILRDTRLTFFMSGGIQSVAADSDKLGGQLPAYYGTAAAVETAQSTASAAGTLAQTNASNIATLQSNVANLQMKKLWENTSPTSSFSSQTITLSSDDYDYLDIYFKGTASDGRIYCNRVLKGFSTIINRAASSTSSYGVSVLTRDMTFVSDTSLTIGDCHRGNAGSAETTANTYNIPYAIYGGKFA